MNQQTTDLDLPFDNKVELLEKFAHIILAAIEERVNNVLNAYRRKIEMIHTQSCSDDYVRQSYTCIYFLCVNEIEILCRPDIS
jgi:hypothetical protein